MGRKGNQAKFPVLVPLQPLTRTEKGGMELTWGNDATWLDPVLSDAKELTFTITEFGDWEGPWEFRIPLQ